MIKFSRITRDYPDAVLNKLLELHKQLELQEKEVSEKSGFDVLEHFTGYYETVDSCLENIVYGVFVDGALSGFISGYTSTGNVSPILHVCLLFIEEEHRRKGYAKELYNQLKSEVGDIEYVTLVVYNGNHDALRFYKSIGFTPYASFLGAKP